MKKREVHASVKDERLIQKRRDQMINGAVKLFIEKGFHRTTTREIARSAGFSIGTLYEYIRTKEDVLYLVCDRIYDQVRERLQKILDTKQQTTLDDLRQAIANYFRVVDGMQDEVLVMYQEVKSLPKDALPYVLRKELEMVDIFKQMLERCVENGEISLSENQIKMHSHNIYVQGQMWAFRRWELRKLFTLDEYIELQMEFLVEGAKGVKENTKECIYCETRNVPAN
ncbi:TetR/AcrR family transcriptional regulator [Niallia endozanthoxylica]|uniref:TetR/AcrR family transcriptional regulator n=1 Tax=Niallia endozanthoxylica TaxID=2036016 RepID=A0A5J5I8U7_9BACI|nr:TetR/AcrR family transcriptional regulator [Niallia endozanthoxylica]KAA9032823.1 TetR/AcrR family transcriptional regulator [Niallia endozanthoxylica]